MPNSKPTIVFAWDQFGPYHMDRCEACAQAFGDRCDILGIELMNAGDIYQWAPTGPGTHFRKITLFPGCRRDEVGGWRHFAALVSACLRSRAKHIFLCDFQFAPIFFAAVALRLCGRRVVVMQDSKFDDKPRLYRKELLKVLLYKPYNAALVGSQRSRLYLEFLGVPPARIFLGYDTLSTERLRKLAGVEPAPGGVPHGERHFTIIARFVPQKNLAAAIEAYARYRRGHAGTPRDLHLCGGGPLEDALRQQVERLGIGGVRFRGYLQEEAIAKTLGSTLALILPSIEEPFGLVVNEALALGVPVIVSENCGARDLLVRSGINGHVVEPDNVDGLAHFMAVLDGDEAEWRRLAANTAPFRAAADTRNFVAAVEQVVAALSPQRRGAREGRADPARGLSARR